MEEEGCRSLKQYLLQEVKLKGSRSLAEEVSETKLMSRGWTFPGIVYW